MEPKRLTSKKFNFPRLGRMTMLPPDPLFVLQNDFRSVTSILIDEENNKTVCGLLDGSVVLFNFETYRQTSTFENGKESCLALAKASKEKEDLLVQDKVGIIRVWSKDIVEWVKLKEINVNYIGFCKAQIYGGEMVCPSEKAQLKILSFPDLEVLATHVAGISKETGEVMALSVFERSNNKYVIVAFECGLINVIDHMSGVIKSKGFTIEDCPMAIDFENVTMRGVIGTSTAKLTIFSISSNFSLNSLRTVTLNSEGVASIRIRGDRKLVAIGNWDGRLRLLSWRHFVTLAVLDVHSQTVNCIEFTSKPPYVMVAGCKEGQVSFWDIYNANSSPQKR